jgi:hypothetical protein
MFVMFFGPFHHAPWWYTNMWRYFLLCQCHALHKLEWATVQYNWRCFLFEGVAANACPVEPVYESIYDFIDQWEDSRPLADSFFPPDPSLVIQAIVHGVAIMVSDGSYKPLLLTKIGAAAWILE